MGKRERKRERERERETERQMDRQTNGEKTIGAKETKRESGLGPNYDFFGEEVRSKWSKCG